MSRVVQKSVYGVKCLPLTLECELCVLFKRAHESYMCNVYGSGDAQESGEKNASVALVHGKTANITLMLPRDASIPYFLHFDLYSLGNDPESDLFVTLPLALGTIPFRGLYSKPLVVSLTDIEGVKMATIAICNSTFEGPKTIAAADVLAAVKPNLPAIDTERERDLRIQKPFSLELERAIHSAYSSLGHVATQRLPEFKTTSSYFGDIPMLAFAYGCTRILHDRGQSESLLVHLMKLSGSMLGFNVEQFGSRSAQEKGDWLAEMSTLFFRGEVYSSDSVRRGSSASMRPADLWSRLNAFPNTSTGGFDCEDGAAWILELLLLLRHGKFDDEYLNQMQQFYKPYTACFALGDIRSRNGMVHHAYVALLDTRFVVSREPSISEYLPAIVVECTTYTRGTWIAEDIETPKKLIEAEIRYNDMQQLFAENREFKTNQLKYTRACKHCAEVSMVVQGGMYGSVQCLVVPEMPDGSVAQFIVCNKGKVGAPPAHLYLYKPGVTLALAVSVARDDLHKLDTLLVEFPRSKLPLAPNTKSYPLLNTRAEKSRFLIRAREFEENKQIWKEAFESKSSDSDFVFKPVKVQITDLLAVYAVDV